MNGRGTDALRLWQQFLSQALVKRLDPANFAALVPLQQSRAPLSPTLIADLLARPDAKNNYAPDPLVPGYLDVLLKQRLVTPAAVLLALAKYSSARPPEDHNDEQNAEGGRVRKSPEGRRPRWANSYTIEQVVFLRLAKSLKQENAIGNGKDAVGMIRVLVSWMSLFSDMAAAFAADVMGAMYPNNIKLELECSRSAFVLLLSSVCDSPVVVAALSGTSAKGKWLDTAILTVPRIFIANKLLQEVANSSPRDLPNSCRLFRLPKYHPSSLCRRPQKPRYTRSLIRPLA
jgi:mediator of RNA polymerase II transcription subunit 5